MPPEPTMKQIAVFPLVTSLSLNLASSP